MKIWCIVLGNERVILAGPLNKAALTPNYLISPYNITSKSHIKVTKIKEMITKKKRNFGWLKKFFLSTP